MLITPAMETATYARHAYQAQMADLEHKLLEMGSLAEQLIGDAAEALHHSSTPLARSVIDRDDEIDRLDLEIEAQCLALMALQHPTATDFRIVGTILKMITDIERVGDLCVDLAKIAIKVEAEFGEASTIDIQHMVTVSRQMFRGALEAYVKRDLALVHEVCELEQTVDRLYRELRAQVFANMQSDANAVVVHGWLLLAIHHVERIADHAVNIVERVNFMVTGKFESLGNQ